MLKKWLVASSDMSEDPSFIVDVTQEYDHRLGDSKLEVRDTAPRLGETWSFPIRNDDDNSKVDSPIHPKDPADEEFPTGKNQPISKNHTRLRVNT